MSVLLLFKDGGGGVAQAGMRGFFAFWMGGGGGLGVAGGLIGMIPPWKKHRRIASGSI